MTLEAANPKLRLAGRHTLEMEISLKSMTGFGRASAGAAANKTADKLVSEPGGDSNAFSAVGSAEVEVSVRSVNGRYLEMRFHLPREYAGFENELKSRVQAIFSRGTIDIFINRARTFAAQNIEININPTLAKKWLESYSRLGAELDLPVEPKLDALVRIPEVLQIEQRPQVDDTEKVFVLNLMSEAAAKCDQEREREGSALRAELVGLCDRLEVLAELMAELKADANAELEKRFRDRLTKLGLDGKIDDQRLAQEIVLQIDRTDISEELSRLREHLKAYRGLLLRSDPQGKKLDFYAQELLREVNTIGSKSHIAKLTGHVVDAKTVVEKIREQVQNVE